MSASAGRSRYAASSCSTDLRNRARASVLRSSFNLIAMLFRLAASPSRASGSSGRNRTSRSRTKSALRRNSNAFALSFCSARTAALL